MAHRPKPFFEEATGTVLVVGVVVIDTAVPSPYIFLMFVIFGSPPSHTIRRKAYRVARLLVSSSNTVNYRKVSHPPLMCPTHLLTQPSQGWDT